MQGFNSLNYQVKFTVNPPQKTLLCIHIHFISQGVKLYTKTNFSLSLSSLSVSLSVYLTHTQEGHFYLMSHSTHFITVIWRQTIQIVREETCFPISSKSFNMHHPTDRIAPLLHQSWNI